MKKIYLLLGLVSYQSYSQDVQRSATAISFTATIDKVIPEETSQTTVLLKKNGVYVKAYLNNIPSAVMSDFLKKYESVSQVSWKIDDDKITGNFTITDQKITLNYKKNGYLLSTRKTYDSTRLIKPIKRFIQDELGKGYYITNITEVINEGLTQYEINLTNDSKICVVRISQTKEAEPHLDEKIFYIKADTDKV